MLYFQLILTYIIINVFLEDLSFLIDTSSGDLLSTAEFIEKQKVPKIKSNATNIPFF